MTEARAEVCTKLGLEDWPNAMLPFLQAAWSGTELKLPRPFNEAQHVQDYNRRNRQGHCPGRTLGRLTLPVYFIFNFSIKNK